MTCRWAALSLVLALGLVGSPRVWAQQRPEARARNPGAIAEITRSETGVSDEFAISYVADEVVLAFQQEGRALNWPGGVEPSNPSSEAEYPRDVWGEAETAWTDLTPEERADFKTELTSGMQANADTIREHAVQAGFRESFGALDLLFVFLAIGSAYKLGSGAQAQGQQA